MNKLEYTPMVNASYYQSSAWRLRVDELSLKKDEQVTEQQEENKEDAPAYQNHV